MASGSVKTGGLPQLKFQPLLLRIARFNRKPNGEQNPHAYFLSFQRCVCASHSLSFLCLLVALSTFSLSLARSVSRGLSLTLSSFFMLMLVIVIQNSLVIFMS